MSIEESGVEGFHIEEAGAEVDYEDCPCCGETEWLKLRVDYKRGACHVIYCVECGKPVEERWSIKP